MRILIAIAIGGAAGALARYGVSAGVQNATASTLPWGTFTVNVVGCLLIGFCAVWLPDRVDPVWRSAVTLGFLGAFTTFSTYSLDAVELIDKSSYAHAAVYLFGSIAVGLAATLGGMALARAIFGS